MSEVNVIEQAVEKNLFFTELGGQRTVQDLYQTALTDLDKLYKALRSQLKGSEEDSLLSTTSSADRLLKLKIDVVIHVVRTIQARNAAKIEAAERRSRKAMIKELIEKKKIKGLEEMSIEDLEKQMEEL